LATNEILFGDYTRVFTDLERYMKVTPEMIQKVARTYLSPERSSLGRRSPEGGLNVEESFSNNFADNFANGSGGGFNLRDP
jgi:predicted Zn-dependent peptidase